MSNFLRAFQNNIYTLVKLTIAYLQDMTEVFTSAKNQKSLINQLQAQIIFDSSLNGIMAFKSVRNNSGKIIDFECILSNPQAEKIIGQKANFLIGKTTLHIFPKIKPSLLEKYINIVNVNKPQVFEHFYPEASKWIYSTVVKLNDGLAIIFSDITERKKNEDSLRKSAELLSNSESIAHLGSWEWDIVNDKVFWSDELYRIFGYAPDEIQVNKDTLMKHLFPDDIELVNSILENALLNNNIPPSFTHRIIRANGEIRTLMGKCKVMINGNNQAVKILCSALDISEQNETINKILKTEGLYRTLAKNIPDATVMLYDKSLKFTLIDGSIDYNLGFNKNMDVVGKEIKEVLSKEHYNKYISFYMNALKGNEDVIEIENRNRFYKVHFMPVKNEYDEIFAGMAVAHDITELKQYQRELELRIDDLNKSNTDLEQFAYVASHDLQEPLRKIQTFGDRLSVKFKEQLGDEGKNYIERMQHASARMQTLIDDLLTFSKLTNSFEPLVKIPLSPVVNEVLLDLEITIEQLAARIIIGELPTVYGIPGQIRQLFQNIISNALKFSKKDEPPLIHISSEIIMGNNIGKVISPRQEYYKYCRIAISDNGIGFEKKYLDRIFVIFQRLHGRNDYQGSGIGLAICKKIVENNRGFITAESKVNHGSTFIITLPLKQSFEDQLSLNFQETLSKMPA